MEGSLYDLTQLFGANKEITGVTYDPSCLVSPAIQQQTLPNPLVGIYQEEESVDFSALVEACEKNISPLSGCTTRSSSAGFFEQEQSFTFENLIPDLNMFNNNNTSPYQTGPLQSSGGLNLDFNPHTPHMAAISHPGSVTLPNDTLTFATTSAIPPSSTAPTGNNGLIGNEPLLTKSPRPAKNASKKFYDKSSEEYRDKRERNNVAVRKSRNKSKQRVMETEQRVRELEEENSNLQNKITLLLKELNVLKSLFASAGGVPSIKTEVDGLPTCTSS